MRATWPEPVERVAAYLREAGAEARLEELDSGTATAEDAAKAAGCTLEQIVKAIVVMCDGKPVVALVPGSRRADLDKIARAVGAAKAKIARPAEVEEATGFSPGAVAPFPLPNVERVLIDQTLADPRRRLGRSGLRHASRGLASRCPRSGRACAVRGRRPGLHLPFRLRGDRFQCARQRRSG